MTNRELIERLKKIPLDAEVEFDVETYPNYVDTYSRIGDFKYCEPLRIVSIELDIGT